MTETPDDVEALKVHRIEPTPPRKHLHVLGSPTTPEEEPPNELDGLRDDGKPRDEDEIIEDIVASMKTIFDPEIPVNIYELGLIYGIDIDEERSVVVRMTLTAPGCPVAGSLVGEVARKTAEIRGVKHAKVDLVFDPPWTMEKMSDEAKLELGLL